MNFRKVIIGLMAAALVASLGVTAQTLGGPLNDVDFVGRIENPDEREQVVEGHTVYEKIENRQGNNQAAVVVFVQNQTRGDVLWFDDSFLHQAGNTPACGGSVWATHEGGLLLSDRSQYIPDKTYVIEDPENPLEWRVTEYEGPTGFLGAETRAWAVEVQFDTVTNEDTDDEECTAYFADGIPAGSDGDGVFETADTDAAYSGTNGDPDATPPTVEGFNYNALLWFEFGFGHLQGEDEVKEFGDGGADSETHSTAEDDGSASNSPQEGNSHPYNTGEAGEADGGEPAERHNHTAVNIQLYYLNDEGLTESDDTFSNTLGGFHEHGD
jgi:hypothetical protein